MKKDNNIRVNDLLKFIPEALLSNLSISTNVDHYAKVLHGKKMFYLLLYGILENDRLSQRTLEDTFNDPVFKLLFNLDEDESVVRSSISERLSKINPDFFKQIYECIYDQFSSFYISSDPKKHNIIRVDSSLVSEAAGKLKEGMDYKTGKRHVKYSLAFDGVLPCLSEVFTASTYSSEENALPEVVFNHVKKEAGHQNIYVLDRGLQSTRTMNEFSHNQISFISRSKENRKYVELESLMQSDMDLNMGESTLVKDSKVFLYTGTPIKNKQGNIHYRQELVEQPYRLTIVHSKNEEKQKFWFISNNFELTAREIAQAYRKRWDIEVFFRFIKQELNTSHLVSLNKNGIEVMLYMTLITSMLILMYKHANELGYKTAKRRVKMELRDLIIAMIVVQCGGNPDLFFNKT
jgi:hypothetical protein